MADGAAGSCLSLSDLSDLSDDLLRHILSFAPQRERAVTAVLSRRWLTLWRTSGDVYLDSRSFNGGCFSPVQEREAFLHGAEKALAVAAAHGDIRRLTFCIAEDSVIGSRSVDNLMDALVSNPASRRVEELKIEVKPLNSRCTVSFGSLPSKALRQLCLINCSKLTTTPPPGAAAFQKLVELHLELCSVSLVEFQTIIDAAPQLSTLHLKSSCVCIENTTDDYDDNEDLVGRLFIPAVTDLVLEDCAYGYDEGRIELDAPRLQYFRYIGHVQQTNKLSLMPSNMIQVDLHLTYDFHGYNATPTRNLFWQFIQNFTTTKLLKLKLDNFITMDDTGECSFRCLQNHLQRVSSQFFMDEVDCIEVQLAKFFAQNAMVLQEMHIDDGSQEMLEHVHSGLRTWIVYKKCISMMAAKKCWST